MISFCPICNDASFEVVLTVDQFPIFQLTSIYRELTESHFNSLKLVRCLKCGHLYNRDFDEKRGDSMYQGDILSNVPVHTSMSRNLEKIVNWVGSELYINKRVIEVGAGSGHLARIIAQTAASVFVSEPSTGLRPEMLPEKNITLCNKPFFASLVKEPADLIVCRQVLEHVADPLQMLCEMRTALASQGRLYLELPATEYIETRASLFDIYYAHVHYFHESNLRILFGRAGFEVDRQWYFKDGHDYGVLLCPCDKIQQTEFKVSSQVRQDLADHLQSKQLKYKDTLRSVSKGRVALYGATWQGISFLSLFQSDCRFQCVFDDNRDYRDQALYSREQVLPVIYPTREELENLDVIIITAYLHDQVIAEKLRDMKFRGRILSIRNEDTFIYGM